MTTTIQIKRSTGSTSPNVLALAESELAYTQDKSNDGASAILYIESVNNDDSPVIHKVGGKYYTDIVDTATDDATANKLVKRGANGSFSANTVSANTFVGNIAGSLSVARTINLQGNVTGNVVFDGSQDVTIETSSNVAYIQNVTAGTGIVASGGGGIASNAVITLEDTAVTPAIYGGLTQIPVLTVDQQGRITNAVNTEISTSFTLGADSGTPAVFNNGETLYFVGGTALSSAVVGNVITFYNEGVTSLSGTSNEIEVSSSNAAVQIGLPNDVTVQNDLTVSGNLFVLGTAVTISTASVSVEDPLVKFGNANPADVLDIGFYGEYTSAGNVLFSGLYRDASDSGVFKLFADLTTDPVSNVINEANFGLATLKTNIVGGNISSLASAIAVPDGGTGKQSVTLNAILYGQGTSAMAEASGNSGEVLQITESGVPVFAGLDGGTF